MFRIPEKLLVHSYRVLFISTDVYFMNSRRIVFKINRRLQNIPRLRSNIHCHIQNVHYRFSILTVNINPSNQLTITLYQCYNFSLINVSALYNLYITITSWQIVILLYVTLLLVDA